MKDVGNTVKELKHPVNGIMKFCPVKKHVEKERIMLRG